MVYLTSTLTLRDNLTAKITNFEFSGQLGRDKTLIGTPAWAAPEILRGEPNYSEKVDVYSFAMRTFLDQRR